MILFQVRDLAAKACGEPHVAPSWEIAKASLGAMLAKTPELAERAKSIMIECIGPWDPASGVGPVYVPEDRESSTGDVCLDQFREAVASEENKVQAQADGQPVVFHEGLKESEVCDDGE